MGVKRIKPNIRSDHFDESRAFYEGVIGLEEHGSLDWILFFGGDRHEVQLSVTRLDVKAHIHPEVSIEVDDVDAIYQRFMKPRSEIVKPLPCEAWLSGLSLVQDPN